MLEKSIIEELLKNCSGEKLQPSKIAVFKYFSVEKLFSGMSAGSRIVVWRNCNFEELLC